MKTFLILKYVCPILAIKRLERLEIAMGVHLIKIVPITKENNVFITFILVISRK